MAASAMAIPNSIEFWDGMKDEYLSHNDIRDNPIEYPIISQHVEGSVVEFGPAFGCFWKYLAYYNQQKYLGIEISKTLLAEAIQRNPSAKFIEGDLLNNNIASRSFDTVVVLQLLEHFNRADFAKALCEMIRIANLKIILSVPNREMIPDSSHMQIFTYESMFDILKVYGPVTFLPGQAHHIIAMIRF